MRDSALLVVLLLLVLAVGMIGSFLTEGSAPVPEDDARRILDVALTKVRRALWIYHADNSYPWDVLLKDHAALSLDPERPARAGAAPADSDDAPVPGRPGHFLGVSSPCGSGTFYAVVRDNDDLDGDLTRDSDGRLVVHITAATAGGKRERVEALLDFESGVARLAVRTLRRLP